jgi:hypothetical protein
MAFAETTHMTACAPVTIRIEIFRLEGVTLSHTDADYDRQILLQPDVEAAFSEASAECFAQGSEGLGSVDTAAGS